MLSGTDLCAAFCDVAVADAEQVLEILGAVLGVERVHLERGGVNEKSRADKFLVFCVVAKHVTNVLAQKTLDALAKFLHAVDVFLLHSPRAVLGVGRSRFEFLDAFFDLVIPRDVCDQVLDRRKRPHRFDRYRLVERDRVEPRHAHQLRHTVDLGRARAAFSGFAVPATSEVPGGFGLYLMHGVEHDHPLGDLGLVVDHLAAVTSAASDAECCLFIM